MGGGQVTVAQLMAAAFAIAGSLPSLLTASGLIAVGLDPRTHPVIDDAPVPLVRATTHLVI